jgi:hypothetical protein
LSKAADVGCFWLPLSSSECVARAFQFERSSRVMQKRPLSVSNLEKGRTWSAHDKKYVSRTACDPLAPDLSLNIAAIAAPSPQNGTIIGDNGDQLRLSLFTG